MLSLAVELSTSCRSCQSPIALNAVVARAQCDRCNRPIDLGAHTWKALLNAALSQGRELDGSRERATAITTEVGTIQVVVRRKEHACPQCSVPTPIDAALASGTQSWVYACAGCGMRVVARPPPKEIDSKATLLLNEESELLWPQQRKEAVVLRCAGCGSPVSVDGATPRITACTHCSAQVYVPDDLWALLHPVRAVRAFTVVAPAPAKGAGGKKPRTLKWDEAHDLVIDRESRLYLAITVPSGKTELVALAPDGQEVLWTKELPARYAEYPRLAIAPSGHVCVWAVGKRSLLGVRLADGQTEVELGTDKRGDGPDAQFDLRECDSLTVDSDGTIVAAVTYSGGLRLVRYDARGARLPLYPGLPENARGEENPLMLEEAGDRAVSFQVAFMGRANDGLLWIGGSQALAAYDRQGKQRFVLPKAELLGDVGGPAAGSVATDAKGHVYAWTASELYRITVANKRAELWLSNESGGLLRTETVLAIAPDGSVWAVGPEGAMRHFDPQKRLLFASARSRQDDREAVESDAVDETEEEEVDE